MPRKAKEKIEELNIKSDEKVTVSKKSTKSKSTQKKEVSTKKNETTKKSTTTKSTTNKTTSKSSSTRKKTVEKKPKVTTVEYYDLPFRYNETVVKILAQTPNILFIYWDISDDDRKSYEEQFGKDFFEKTKPVLIITNSTMNYTFEVEINDFANSWYLNINDASCDYKVELGRRFITYSDNSSYIPLTSSNNIEAPNDHILFDKLGQSVFFRNIKTDFVQEKQISSLSYLQNIGKIYNIYDLYKEIYKDELNIDELGINLSSSSSSTFK